MSPNVPEQLSRTIETLYRSESGRILATLVRLLGDLDLAEEAMHEAFAAALDTWRQAGIPDSPRPSLISTARFKAIDGMRRRARFDAAQTDLALYRAVAVAMCGHPEKGLALIDALLARGELVNYHLAHSARAELCRRLCRLAEASASYEKALALVWQESDRRFLAGRLQELK